MDCRRYAVHAGGRAAVTWFLPLWLLHLLNTMSPHANICSMLSMPADELLRVAGDRPNRYSPSEWVALLAVAVPGRAVTEAHWQQLRKARHAS